MRCATEFCEETTTGCLFCARHLRHPQCDEPGCRSEARPFDIYCGLHDRGLMFTGKCEHPGCTWTALIEGLCTDHYRTTVVSDPLLRQPAAPARAWRTPTCPLRPKPEAKSPARRPKPEKEVRQKRKPRLILNVEMTPESVCSRDGCEKPISDRHLCWWHLQAVLNAERPQLLCREQGCDRPVKSRGWCRSHYRLQLISDPTRPRCSVESCDRASMVAGMCELHFQVAQRKRRKNVTA